MATSFKDLQDIVLDLMEQEDSITRDRVKKFLNMAGHDIFNRYAWKERRKSSLFRTVAPYTTGTAATTNDSTAVVGTGTAWSTAGIGTGLWKFSRGVSEPWYRIESVGSETAAVLDQESLEATADTTYQIYSDEIQLPTDAQSLVHLTSSNPGSSGVMAPLARQELDAVGHLPGKTGSPTVYATQEVETERLTVRLWPIPDGEYRLEAHYLAKWTELVDDGQIPVLSEEKRDLLILGALKWGYMQAFESGKSQQMAARYEHELERAWTRDKRRTPLTARLQTFDGSRGASGWLTGPFGDA